MKKSVLAVAAALVLAPALVLARKTSYDYGHRCR